MAGSVALGVKSDDVGTANRIVGFYEYTKALKHLDEFVRSATDAEIQAADEIIQQRDEFAVYVNLSRLLQQKSTNLGEKPLAKNDDFQRRGLRWLTAIARVEVHAVLAAFSGNRDPFSVLPATEFDRDEYNEVLLDGTRTHYWAFQKDPTWPRELASGVPSSRTLAYLRRLAMLSQFVHAVMQRMGDQFDVGQAAEITSWQRQIRKASEQLTSKVSAAVARSQLRSIRKSTQFHDLLEQCKGACARMR